jgi:hypothetical protein
VEVAVLIALAPVILLGVLVVVLVGLLAAASAVQRARARVVDRQIRVTDAIHAELGAVVSPVVERSVLGGWTVRVAAPLERPSVVERVVAIADRVMRADSAAPVRIVITSQTIAPRPRAA